MNETDVADAITKFFDVMRVSGGFRFDAAVTLPASVAGGEPVPIDVVLSGPDTDLLLARNGELLHAFESLTAAVLRLLPEEIRFDAGGFQATRAAAIQSLVEDAIARVAATGRPQSFPPMNSRERRLVHLALVPSGLSTASSGIGSQRFVVLYPAGQRPDPARFERPSRGSKTRGGTRDDSRRAGDVSYGRPRRSPGVVSGSPPPQFDLPHVDQAETEESQRSFTSDGADPGATEARLESIRRAFRKR